MTYNTEDSSRLRMTAFSTVGGPMCPHKTNKTEDFRKLRKISKNSNFIKL